MTPAEKKQQAQARKLYDAGRPGRGGGGGGIMVEKSIPWNITWVVCKVKKNYLKVFLFVMISQYH